MINNSCFTEFGKAFKRGEFDKLPRQSLEFKDLWEEQLNRVLNGYSVGGKWMSGTLYSYVNFGTINILSEDGENKVTGLPHLRDVEWMLDYYMQEAKAQKKGLFYVSGRRLGKSFFGSWNLAYNINFWDQPCAVGAGLSKYSSDLTALVKNHLYGLKNTPFFKEILSDKSNDSDVPITLGWESKNTEGKWEKNLTGGLLYNVNFHNNPTAANGKTTKFFLFEEVGMFDNLIAAASAAKFCWQDGSVNYGFPLFHGTGGDMGKGTLDAEKMFHDPDAYNLLAFTDEERPGVKTALFIPGIYAMNECRNEEGEIDEKKAKEIVLQKRDKLKKAKDLQSLFDELQYVPLTPGEAFLRQSGNTFPTELIQHQLERITNNASLHNLGQIGKMTSDCLFEPDFGLRPAEYPPKKDTNKGAVVIWEHPSANKQFGDYIIGVDPYAQDQSSSSPSLGSCIVYKRLISFKETYDIVVAEYTARPDTVDDFYEVVRRLAIYYKAKVLYEANIIGLKQYMEKTHSLHCLAETPTIVRDIIDNVTTQIKTGVIVSAKLKSHLISLINTYLKTEYAEGHYQTEKIYSVPLLQELLKYDNDGNFDRVIAFGLCLLQDSNDFRTKVETKLTPVEDISPFVKSIEKFFV